jgi:hypothetical protein
VAKTYVARDTKFLGQLYNVMIKTLELFARLTDLTPQCLMEIVGERTRIRLEDAMTPEYIVGNAGCTPPEVFQYMITYPESGPENWVPPLKTAEEQTKLDRAFGVF